MEIFMLRYDLDDEWIREHYDTDTIASMEEMLPYELIHALLNDIRRLEKLVMDTRTEVHRLSTKGAGYHLFAQDVHDGTYYDHPALSRYIDLFGSEAIVPW
jgi:hypothetical protein